MQMLPVYVPEDMTLTRLSFAMLPWLSPSYSGMIGATAAKPSEPIVAVTFEWPITWLALRRRYRMLHERLSSSGASVLIKR